MNTHADNNLSEQHLLQFGAITQGFAHYEFTLQQIMATVTGADLASIIILSSGLDFSDKRRTLLNLLRQREIPLDQFDKIFAFLQIPHTYVSLRHEIAHYVWRSSAEPDSIQPDWIFKLSRSIEPVRGETDLPSGRFIALTSDTPRYTLDELRDIATTLAENHRRFVAYLQEIGLLHDA